MPVIAPPAHLEGRGPHAKACLDALMSWVHAQGGPDTLFAPASGDGVEGLFDVMAERRVRREYAGWLDAQPPSVSA